MPHAGVSPLTGDRTPLRDELNTPAHNMSRPTHRCMVDDLSKETIGGADITNGAALMSAERMQLLRHLPEKITQEQIPRPEVDSRSGASLTQLLLTPMTVFH